MSTTTSPQPPKPGSSPFKAQSPFDPYLPLSTEDEQLTEIRSAQNNTSSNTRAAVHKKSASAEAQAGPELVSTRRVNSRQEETFGGVDRTDSYGYGSLEGIEPQGFDNTFLLESNFGPLPAPEDPNDMNFFRQSSFRRTDTGRTDEPQSAATSRATDFSRRSTGIATHSSQLMSPVLTDVASPASAHDGPFSPNHTKLLGGGDMSRVSSQSTTVANHATTSKALGVAQRTPALTSSSNDVSPNLGDEQQPFGVTPSIQVDYHRRGDSPARVDDIQHSLNKRRRGSHSSSLLAAHSAQDEDEADQEEDGPQREARSGLGPQARGNEAVSSLEEQQQQREVSAKNMDVNQWLRASLHEALEDPNPPMGIKQQLAVANTRRRAVSNSNPSDLPAEAWGFSRGLQANSDSRTPGPGVLVFEESEDEEMDDDDGSFVESAPASVDGHDAAAKAEELDTFPPYEDQTAVPQQAHPWIDPIFMPSANGMNSQPETANAAMIRFMKRARDIETASRVATWGTTRRKSDGDMQIAERVFGSDGLLSRLSISRSKEKTEKEKDEWRNFMGTVQQAADRILPKRANSATKRKTSEPRPAPRESHSYDSGRPDVLHKRKESSASLGSKSSGQTLLSRIPSTKRPKSPRINTSTSGLAAAVATQIGALGVSGSIQPASPPSPGGWRAFKETVQERLGLHHKSESPEASRVSSPPPVTIPQPAVTKPVVAEGDADGDEDYDQQGIKMDMDIPSINIIPNFEGFKAHVRETFPRLPEYLVDRLGQEQLRRYKKLVSAKVDHTKAKELGNCGSGHYCVARGGQPTYFPAKAAQKEPSHTGFTTAGTGEDDEDEEAVADGVVSEAQFPKGLPMPPAKRLPAEFECTLCFTVKKFQKPSDWSKHVHEDLQPFTCTFQKCPEPKSFKRKADWVRHENERHRQLEWWQCTEEGCSHLCYRRDNFVQHLVREHKMPEPKAKNNNRPNKPAVRGPAKGKVKIKGPVNINEIPPEDRVLHMVEICRRETSKNPLDEPCRFCGNLCNSFKKLTVHLARHMETLSLPVLELVKAKDVSADTIISPIDVKLAQQPYSPATQMSYRPDSIDESSYNRELDTNNFTMSGLYPVALSSQSSPYQPMWGSSPATGVTQSTHMPQTSTPAFVSMTAGTYGGAPVATNNTYQQTSFGEFGGSRLYSHHDSLPGSELYAMGAASGAQGFLPLDQQQQQQQQPQQQQRPHFQTPHYVDQNGRTTGGLENGLVATTMAPGHDDLGLQYDTEGNSAYANPGSGMFGTDAQNAGQGPYYNY